MIRLLGWVSRLIVCIALLLTLVRLAGGAQISPLAALLEGYPCAQPCWHGIEPGQTTLVQAARNLDKDGRVHVNTVDLYELCWSAVEAWPGGGCATHWSSADPNTSIERLVLWPPYGQVEFGDMLAAFGDPTSLDLCRQPGGSVAHVYFKNNVEVVVYPGLLWPAPRPGGRFRPDMAVGEILYQFGGREMRDQPPQSWHGFTSPEPRWTCLE